MKKDFFSTWQHVRPAEIHEYFIFFRHFFNIPISAHQNPIDLEDCCAKKTTWKDDIRMGTGLVWMIALSKPHRSRGLLCKKTTWQDDIRVRTGLVWFGCLPCPGWGRCPGWRGAQWRTRETSYACLSAPAHAHKKMWNINGTVWRDPNLSFNQIFWLI